jgi:Domain of unknown function (DUF4190)
MSQYPPPPPSPGQPPFGQPPMQPPYGQQAYGQPGFPPQPRGTSGAAIGSLICGILFCVPLITSLLAIILGFVGIKATGNNRAGGRGLAIAGLILGLLGIIGWSIGGVTMVIGFAKAKEMASQNCQPFVQAVSAGDYSKASAYSNMPQEDMQTLHDQIAGWGALNNMSISGFNFQKNAGTPGHMNMNGHASFATVGAKDFDAEMESSAGQFKVVKIEFK